MIEIGPNLTAAIQAVSVVCDVISFVLLLYLWRKSEQLQKENERLQKQIRYQEHRDGRIKTHDPICYGYGPSHYECALRKIDMLRELLNADNQTLRLHLGELTLKEMRIIKSAFQWVLIRAELKEGE